MRADPVKRTDDLPEDNTEPFQPEKEPGNTPKPEPGNRGVIPDAERPPQQDEGVVPGPEACGCGPETVQEVSGA
jgi:hypothetical protein